MTWSKNKLVKKYQKLWNYLKVEGLEEIETKFKADPYWWCLEYNLLNKSSYLDACYYICKAHPKIEMKTLINL